MPDDFQKLGEASVAGIQRVGGERKEMSPERCSTWVERLNSSKSTESPSQITGG